MTTKPVWMETWKSEDASITFHTTFDHVRLRREPGERVTPYDLDVQEQAFLSLAPERARLAAWAPAMVRALLEVEWGDPEFGCRKCCATITFDGRVHARGCDLDAALTAVGLSTQQQRDEAREMIRKVRP